MFSVICPLICEDLWQKLRDAKLVKEESVHLCEWPIADKKKINEKLEGEFGIALEVIEKGLAQRDKIQIGLKWPLAKAKVSGAEVSKELQEIVMTQLNIKDIKVKKSGKEISVELDTQITPELEAEGYARVISRQVQSLRKKAGLVKTDIIKLAIIVGGELGEIIEKGKEMIKERTNASEIVMVEVTPSGVPPAVGIEKDYSDSSDEKVKGKEFKIWLKKV